jgi:hypothetical protein
LFQSVNRAGTALSGRALNRHNAWGSDPETSAQRGVSDAGRVSHRARDRRDGYLENGGRLEHAQQMAAHESPRTTKLYDRTKDEITIGEVERIQL